MTKLRPVRNGFHLGILTIAAFLLFLSGCNGGNSGTASNPVCTATGDVSGVAAVDCFLAESSIVAWQGGTPSTPGVTAIASVGTFTAAGVNSYTVSSADLQLLTGATVWTTATATAGGQYANYYLTATGWQPLSQTSSYVYVNDGNGTLTATTGGSTSTISSITRSSLAGQSVACTNPMGSYFVGQDIGTAGSPAIVAAASCAIPGSYQASSISYTFTATTSWPDLYFLFDFGGGSMITDGAGVELTTLPAVGTRFCLNGWVFDPISGAAPGSDNYNMFYAYDPATFSPSCAATNITTALAGTVYTTALVSLKATGNLVVPNVLEIKYTISGNLFNYFYAFNLNKIMLGYFMASGSVTTTEFAVNKIAANAQLQAYGLPSLP